MTFNFGGIGAATVPVNGNLLPDLPAAFQKLWPHQIPAVEQIVKLFKAGQKIVVLDAAPGAGKTLIAEYVRRQLAIKALFLAHTKTLQQQVVRDFPYARLIMGRDNYPTLDDSSKTADSCDTWKGWPCQSDDKQCDRTRGGRFKHCSYCHPDFGSIEDWCPYMVSKRAAMYSPLAVANIAYAFGEWQAKPSAFKDWPLVVVDEWDTVEDALLGSRELFLTPRQAGRFKIRYPKAIQEMTTAWLFDAAGVMGIEYQRLSAMDNDDRPNDWPKIKTLTQVFIAAASGAQNGSWIPLEHDERKGLRWGPIQVDATLAADALWNNGKQFLLMSGTAIDPPFRLRQLGWKAPVPVVRVPSVYPVQNRPVRVWPVASMLKKNRETSTPLIANALKQILKAHPDDRILVHSGTYQIAEQLMQELADFKSRLVTFASSRMRDDALSRYLTRPKSVLIGPAMERGLDLAGDACRVVVFTRCPYKYMGDPRVQARSKLPGFYIDQAVDLIATLVQATQRGVRSATDTCTVYVLDSQFGKLRTHGLYAPRWPLWWSMALKDFGGF